MNSSSYPSKVTVIVYSAKGLKPKHQGKHKFSVIFGIGSNKFRTDVVEDLFGNPTFNTESEIEVGDPTLPLVLTVTEKQEKDVLGQVVITLTDLAQSRTNRPLKVPLRPHKKCPNPEGEVLLEAWVSAKTLGPPPTIDITGTEGESKNVVTAGFRKLKSKISHSPLPGSGIIDLMKTSVRKSSDSKQHKRSQSESLFAMGQKGFVSCQDLPSMSPHHSNNLDNQHLKVAGNDSLSSLESISETASIASVAESKKPEVNGISPNEGPVEGGTKITIRGTNLGINKADVVGLFVCGSNVLGSLEYVSSSKLTCVTKSWKSCVGNVTVETQSGGKGSSLVQFTFIGLQSDSASDVSSLSRSSSRGDADIHRSESNRSNTSEKAKVAIKEHSARDSPTLVKNLKAKSMFDLSLMTGIAKHGKPEVTGISPMDSPADVTTKLTIRGLNLGLSKTDIVQLVVCGMDCLGSVEYESPSKIFCQVGPAKPGSGDIILETQSGGKGCSLVKFTLIDMKDEAEEDDASAWAAVPYSEPDQNIPESKNMNGTENHKESIPAGGRFGRTSPVNGQSTGRLPPPVVEIQPMRMDKKPASSPFHVFKGNKKGDKDRSSDSHEKNDFRNNEDVHLSYSEQVEKETIQKKIIELEHELEFSDGHIKKLQVENKRLRDENERMRRYMEELVNRAIVRCPEILCVDDKI